MARSRKSPAASLDDDIQDDDGQSNETPPAKRRSTSLTRRKDASVELGSPIVIDATEIATCANFADKLGISKDMMEGVAGNVDVTDQHTYTREENREIFQSTRSFQVTKPAQAAVPHTTGGTMLTIVATTAVICAAISVTIIALFG